MRAVVTDGVVPLQPKFVCLSHSVCLSVCLSSCLSVSLCLSACLSACLSVGHDCDPRSEQTEMLFGLRIAVRGPVKIRRGLRNHVWCIIWARYGTAVSARKATDTHMHWALDAPSLHVCMPNQGWKKPRLKKLSFRFLVFK